MLRARARSAGYSMVEVIVVLLIMSVIYVMAMPTYTRMITNNAVRSATDSVAEGLRAARSEAIKNNTRVQFALVSDMTATCTVPTSGVWPLNWIVSLDDPTTACNVAPSTTVAPRIIKFRVVSGRENQVTLTNASSVSCVLFNGLGQSLDCTSNAQLSFDYDFGASDTGTCEAVGGPVRCLRIQVARGGRIRTCDPALASTNPASC